MVENIILWFQTNPPRKTNEERRSWCLLTTGIQMKKDGHGVYFY